MNVYEKNAWLYGFDKLIGKPATLYYLPTQRSRKWRKGCSVLSYTESQEQQATSTMRQEKWYAFKFEEGIA
jgi:hypothetical protein